jgi:hypothetical protein
VLPVWGFKCPQYFLANSSKYGAKKSPPQFEILKHRLLKMSAYCDVKIQKKMIHFPSVGVMPPTAEMNEKRNAWANKRNDKLKQLSFLIIFNKYLIYFVIICIYNFFIFFFPYNVKQKSQTLLIPIEIYFNNYNMVF